MGMSLSQNPKVLFMQLAAEVSGFPLIGPDHSLLSAASL